ncbi:hypothetical protein TetV_182 [Tetraselmis virus 1]|uniref:Uncharacterized protein n=1 Tax=Tetraselmis virus 1 TaxID=2060617 RepID=A0A2P0VMY8_9VIRU|nr:hypothetical protein QJ968_gp182 [Tetraselmis virus 1]AUF82274.1 hypothetical protein TetV_182 [Tetraselmis virus 1]
MKISCKRKHCDLNGFDKPDNYHDDNLVTANAMIENNIYCASVFSMGASTELMVSIYKDMQYRLLRPTLLSLSHKQVSMNELMMLSTSFDHDLFIEIYKGYINSHIKNPLKELHEYSDASIKTIIGIYEIADRSKQSEFETRLFRDLRHIADSYIINVPETEFIDRAYDKLAICTSELDKSMYSHASRFHYAYN